MNQTPAKLENTKWLNDPNLQILLELLGDAANPARINGGAVRNAVIGEPIADVDISTEKRPEQVVSILQEAGIRVVPTGLQHGTVTAIVGGKGYEVTTLREDVETDGRHAIVKFGTDWKKDALRRDLTMNALYCDRYGNLLDPLGGYDDLAKRRIRFIGVAEDRIREDHLRILRFFRFFAWYGTLRPDAEGLKACTKLKDNLQALSAERVWAEFKKILSAPDPRRALLWMRTTGVLNAILPESEKWGIDLIHPYMDAFHEFGWKLDVIERLETIIPKKPDTATAIGQRLKLSNSEMAQLQSWAMTELPEVDTDKRQLQRILYWGSQRAVCQSIRLDAARLFGKPDREVELQKRLVQMRLACGWRQPKFPVSGRTLLDLGHPPGEAIGNTLKKLEKKWVESDFSMKAEDLLELVDQPS